MLRPTPPVVARSAFWLALAGLVAVSVLSEPAAAADAAAHQPAVAPAAKAETRALWVTRTTLTSPDAIRQMVRAADAGGFNTLIVQVRGRGDSYYNGTLEPRASELAAKPAFDPLATVLDEAHAAGLKVHAWVAVNLVSSSVTLPAAREHVIYRAPEWLMVPRELAAEMKKVDVRSPAYIGRLARWTRAHATEVEGLYTSPVHPGAQAHAAAVIGELVQKYAVDGVHLDYVRFPERETSTTARRRSSCSRRRSCPDLTDKERREAAAREVLDPAAYPNLFADRWDEFRRVGPDRAGREGADGGQGGAARHDRQRRRRSRRAAGQPNRACRTGAAGSTSRCSTCSARWPTRPRPTVFQQQIAAAREYAGTRAGVGRHRRLSPAPRRRRCSTSPRPASSAPPASSCSRTTP